MEPSNNFSTASPHGDDANDRGESASSQGAGETQIPINILLVDDEPKNLTVLESVLDDPGYRLARAESGDEALLALMDGEFALIVLDVHMPGMSGFELAQMIKQRKKTASIPIIFLTAHYHEDRHILEGYQTGAVDYLLKPINSTILRSKVAVFAELHRKTRESVAANATLSAEVAERRRIQEEMVELYSKLEEKVAERTAELQRANSALEQTQSELREADRRKDQFLAMLGHELRNPLAAISNAVILLQRIGSSQPDAKWCQEVIERQTRHLTRLVDDLLDVSRVSRGKIQIEKRVVDLAALAQQAVESCRAFVDSRRHELELSLPSEPIYIEGDATRLVQIIANLVNNAAKYTDVGGKISVSVAAPDCAEVRVRDSGRGLEPEAIANLFELFFQADVNLDRSEGGLGVGLALVKSLVQMHGGTVEAQSAGRGLGSEFVARLPRLSMLEAVDAAPEPAVPTGARSLRVLVVDDNVDAGRSLAKVLEILGHETGLAHNGQDAVKLALRAPPDVIFLDIGLPGMNGYQVCNWLRRNGLKDQLIVAVTGYGHEYDRQLSFEAGFDAHLVKPVTSTMIVGLLDKRMAALEMSSAAEKA